MQPEILERIVFSDDDLLIVNKPSGLLTISDGYDPAKENLSLILTGLCGRVWVVHRLDKETSGLVVFARNAEAHRELNRQFRERLIQKYYYALVYPAPEWKSIKIELPLLPNCGRRHLTKVDHLLGKAAQTFFSVLQQKSGACILECSPSTGYRHQIRAHLYSRGLGIFGDDLYIPKANQAEQNKAPRLMLQAFSLTFLHPLSAEKISFSIPCDPELENFWEQI